MTEPTRAVARPPIGSENHLPTWTRHSLETEVLRAIHERNAQSWWDRPIGPLGFFGGLLLIGALGSAALCEHTPADPLTIAGDQDD